MGWLFGDEDKDVKLTAREKWSFLTEPPGSKDFGKSRRGWKASKNAQKAARKGKGKK